MEDSFDSFYDCIFGKHMAIDLYLSTVKLVLSSHSKKTKKIVKTKNRLMQVKSIAECWPALNYMYHMPLRPLFYLF